MQYHRPPQESGGLFIAPSRQKRPNSVRILLPRLSWHVYNLRTALLRRTRKERNSTMLKSECRGLRVVITIIPIIGAVAPARAPRADPTEMQ
jgi:hypothetical protein